MDKAQEDLANWEKVNSVELFNPHAYVLSEDAASYAVEFKTSITTKDGETANAHGSWMYLFRHLDGRWRVVHSAGTHVPDSEEE
jgi:ketosteroid isomerase-like protein